MLHSFKVENMYSIGKEQEISFETNKLNDNSVAETKFGFINKINCIIGNNGAGKTAVLKCISFFIWLAEESFFGSKIEDPIPFEPHYLNKDKSTKIEMVFEKQNNLFKLEFELNQDIIFYEKLSIKHPEENKFKRVYSVDRRKNTMKTLYGEDLSPLNKKERERVKSKNNSSLFSYLLTTGSLSHLGFKNGIFNIFYSNLTKGGRHEVPLLYDCFRLSEVIRKNKQFKDEMVTTIKSFDVGINDISEKSAGQFVLSDRNNNTIMDNDVISFIHGEGENQFDVPLPSESDGTIRSMSILFPIIDILKNGGLMVIDEIEMSKHPIIIKQLISSFEYSSKDSANVQIIFSTHQPLLLDNRSKSQIFLIEKEDGINTDIYRLDDVEGVKSSENFGLKYLSGRYGAVPRKEVQIG